MHDLQAWKNQLMHALLTPRDHIPLYVGIGVGVLALLFVLHAVSRREAPSLKLNAAGSAPIASINEAPATRCIHCSASMSSRQDFCPACGYAQPVRQTGTGGLPG